MKLFRDRDLKDQIFDCFSFGEVLAGETKEVTLWLLNDASPKRTGHLRDLHFKVHCLDPETDALIDEEKVEVVDAPKEMIPNAVAPITLSWTPSIVWEQYLKAKLTISGKKIIGA